ncbi:protease [Roseomonas sp. KE2513]|uniref:trypsin-like serine peptidase n=1 Tax=Roseomonas sp. KE2513 TaxID=2479202 RepID=UPI0018E02BD8|nr:trypsin-like serine protease [Roseomonas sp. KE2513]MBI0534764.1 protease [Roseomonas sp. KE2513]
MTRPSASLAPALLLAAALSACAAPLPGIGPGSKREAVDVTAAPWRSLGLVETAAGGRCTGALVSPNTVLTAAHCLIDPRTTQPVPAGAVRFTLAASPTGGTGQARALQAVIGPNFSVAPGPRPDPKAPPDSDWAILLLDQPIAAPSLALSLEAGYLLPGTALAFGGYQADREQEMVADAACAVAGYARDPAGHVMLHHSCAGTVGASGGPLLARLPNGGWVVAGIGSLAEGGVTGGWAVPTASIARVALSNRR